MLLFLIDAHSPNYPPPPRFWSRSALRPPAALLTRIRPIIRLLVLAAAIFRLRCLPLRLVTSPRGHSAIDPPSLLSLVDRNHSTNRVFLRVCRRMVEWGAQAAELLSPPASKNISSSQVRPCIAPPPHTAARALLSLTLPRCKRMQSHGTKAWKCAMLAFAFRSLNTTISNTT